MPPQESATPPRTTLPPIAGILRTFLLALFLLGVTGVFAELLLIGHTEDRLQLVPLALFAVSLLVIAWYATTRSGHSIRVFQALMVVFVAAGVVGIILHYRGNMEFELEMYPGLAGVELFRESITGAFPALAPGTMVQLGLIGLAWTFRHPAVHRSIPPST